MSKIVDALEKLRAANKGEVGAKLRAEEVALLLGYIVTLEGMVEKAAVVRVNNNGFFNQDETVEVSTEH